MDREVDVRLRQRSVMEFLFKTGDDSATSIHRKLLPVYGEDTLDRSSIQRWVQRFKEGDFSLLDNPRCGRPSTVVSDVNKETINQIIQNDRCVTTRQLAEMTRLSLGSVVSVVQSLGYRKICARWVPRLLTRELKTMRKDVCEGLMKTFTEEWKQCFDGVITQDETWLFLSEPESKTQSMEWRHPGSPRQKKPKLSRTAGRKVMASFFWDQWGVIFIDFLEPGSTINQDRYCLSLDKLRRAIKTHRPQLQGKLIRLHHDNAKPHTALMTQEKIRKLGWKIVPHPPYSPDLAPSDFYLFGRLKAHLRGKTFDSEKDLISCVKRWCKSQSPEFYQSAFTSWKERWARCVTADGGYIE